MYSCIEYVGVIDSQGKAIEAVATGKPQNFGVGFAGQFFSGNSYEWRTPGIFHENGNERINLNAFYFPAGLPYCYSATKPCDTGVDEIILQFNGAWWGNQPKPIEFKEFNSNLLPKWMTSQQLNGSTTGFVPAWVICYTKPGFAETIKNNINTQWTDVLGNPYRLNVINFKIDRFTVDKSTTFDYDNNLSPPAWTGLPSASPTPDPLDSKNFYILFPRQTILPDET